MPFAVNGKVHIYYEVEGEGPPVMMLHPGMEDSQIFREYGYVDALKKDYQLILRDDKAHGKSNRQYPLEEHTVENTAKDIITVMDELVIDSAHLFGCSGGGLHALQFATLYPKKAKSLIVFGMSPKFGGSNANKQILQLTQAGPEALIEFMEKNMRSEPLPEAEKARIRATDFNALSAAMSKPQDQNLNIALPDMKIPVLVMVGEEDNFFNHETLKDEYSPLPDLAFVTIPGIGHSIERSDLILPHIKEFLARVTK